MARPVQPGDGPAHRGKNPRAAGTHGGSPASAGWLEKNSRPWPACYREWERILAKHPTERVLEILTQDNDEGQRLRQSDPFIGILTEEERMWFLEHYEEGRV